MDHPALLFGQPEMGGARMVRQGCWRQQPDDKSRMTGDCHVRICEGLGVKFPRATRLLSSKDHPRSKICRLTPQIPIGRKSKYPSPRAPAKSFLPVTKKKLYTGGPLIEDLSAAIILSLERETLTQILTTYKGGPLTTGGGGDGNDWV